MRLRDYLLGTPLEIALPLPPEECARRLEAMLGSRFWPFPVDRINGWARADSVMLDHYESPLQSNVRPRFHGRFVADGAGARLTGKLRAPIRAHVLLGVFHLVPLLLLVMLFTGGREPGVSLVAVFAVPLLLCGMFWVFVLAAVHSGDAVRRRLIAGVREACGG